MNDDLIARLESWAQNEEMIDSHFLQHGRDCNEAAARIKEADELLREADYAIDRHHCCDLVQPLRDRIDAFLAGK